MSDEKMIAYLKSKDIEIPEDTNQITNLFFGTLVVDSIKYWHGRSCDFMDNNEPSKPYVRLNSAIAKTDKNRREIFSNLNKETKEQIKDLIRESIEGVLFSLFAKIDEDWKLILKTNGENKKGIVNNDTELHEDLYKWINSFSDK
ncbi:MAG: hypothetical protein LBI87_00295 [Candidatus Accumulibacter sp.]|jgi:hypothetical protein|nr:hypothetical protein [Accumulibacter sp.]